MKFMLEGKKKSILWLGLALLILLALGYFWYRFLSVARLDSELAWQPPQVNPPKIEFVLNHPELELVNPDSQDQAFQVLFRTIGYEDQWHFFYLPQYLQAHDALDPSLITFNIRHIEEHDTVRHGALYLSSLDANRRPTNGFRCQTNPDKQTLNCDIYLGSAFFEPTDLQRAQDYLINYTTRILIILSKQTIEGEEYANLLQKLHQQLQNQSLQPVVLQKKLQSSSFNRNLISLLNSLIHPSQVLAQNYYCEGYLECRVEQDLCRCPNGSICDYGTWCIEDSVMCTNCGPECTGPWEIADGNYCRNVQPEGGHGCPQAMQGTCESHSGVYCATRSNCYPAESDPGPGDPGQPAPTPTPVPPGVPTPTPTPQPPHDGNCSGCPWWQQNYNNGAWCTDQSTCHNSGMCNVHWSFTSGPSNPDGYCGWSEGQPDQGRCYGCTGSPPPPPAPTATPTPTPTPTPVPKTCEVYVNNARSANITQTESVSITFSGNPSSGGELRLFIEAIDGGEVNGIIYNGQEKTAYGSSNATGYRYYELDNRNTDGPHIATLLVSAGEYFLHCDSGATVPARCSGNPFCNYETNLSFCHSFIGGDLCGSIPCCGSEPCTNWVSCSDYDTAYLSVSGHEAWFQGIGGHIITLGLGRINSYIPYSECLDADNCRPALITHDELDSPGFPITAGGLINTYFDATDQTEFIHIDSERSQSVNAHAIDTNLRMTTQGYDYFYNKFGSLHEENILTSNNKPNDLSTEELNVFFTDGNLVINETSNWLIQNDEQVVVFVQGNLTIEAESPNTKIIGVVPGGYLAFIVQGDIAVSDSVGHPVDTNSSPTAFAVPFGLSPTESNLEGIFVADGRLIIESNDDPDSPDHKFIGAGNFIGWGGVDLQRTFEDNAFGMSWHSYNPTESFIYRPDLLINTPQEMKDYIREWREVAPQQL